MIFIENFWYFWIFFWFFSRWEKIICLSELSEIKCYKLSICHWNIMSTRWNRWNNNHTREHKSEVGHENPVFHPMACSQCISLSWRLSDPLVTVASQRCMNCAPPRRATFPTAFRSSNQKTLLGAWDSKAIGGCPSRIFWSDHRKVVGKVAQLASEHHFSVFPLFDQIPVAELATKPIVTDNLIFNSLLAQNTLIKKFKFDPRPPKMKF